MVSGHLKCLRTHCVHLVCIVESVCSQRPAKMVPQGQHARSEIIIGQLDISQVGLIEALTSLSI